MSVLFCTVFKKPANLVLVVLVTLVVFTLAIWLPNISLISVVLGSQTASAMEKMSFLWSLYGSIQTNFTIVSAMYTVAIALFFGIQATLLTYYISKVRGGAGGVKRIGAVSLSGLMSGIFGIGCAACGTFILTSILASFGAAGLLAFLPFGGEEFGVLGVSLLLYSIFLLLKKIKSPLVCELN